MLDFEFEPIEGNGLILKRIKEYLNEPNLLISSGLPQEIPEEMVWIEIAEGSTISEGYQSILVRAKCISKSWKEAEILALKVRKAIEAQSFLKKPIYSVDNVKRPRRSNELSLKEKPVFLFEFYIYQLAINL